MPGNQFFQSLIFNFNMELVSTPKRVFFLILILILIISIIIFLEDVSILLLRFDIYSNVVVAFTSVIAIYVAMSQGRKIITRAQKEHKNNLNYTVRIALFGKRVDFINDLRNRFEKIEELLLALWVRPPAILFANFDEEMLAKMREFECGIEESFLTELSIKMIDLNLYLNQNVYLLSLSKDSINLNEIEPFIEDFKKNINFLISIKSTSIAIKNFEDHNKTECMEFIQKRSETGENTDEKMKFDLEGEMKSSFENWRDLLKEDIQTSLALFKKFQSNLPWKEFKDIYEKIISAIVEESKL